MLKLVTKPHDTSLPIRKGKNKLKKDSPIEFILALLKLSKRILSNSALFLPSVIKIEGGFAYKKIVSIKDTTILSKNSNIFKEYTFYICPKKNMKSMQVKCITLIAHQRYKVHFKIE